MNNNIDDKEYRKDFENSVFCEELDADSIPAELMSELESSMKTHKPPPNNLIDLQFDDIIITD